MWFISVDWQDTYGLPQRSGGRMCCQYCGEVGDHGALLQCQGQVRLLRLIWPLVVACMLTKRDTSGRPVATCSVGA